jgi:hypothetical protein
VADAGRAFISGQMYKQHISGIMCDVAIDSYATGTVTGVTD